MTIILDWYKENHERKNACRLELLRRTITPSKNKILAVVFVVCLGVLGFLFFGRQKPLPERVLGSGVKMTLVSPDNYTISTADEPKLEEALLKQGLKADVFYNATNVKWKRIFEDKETYVNVTLDGDHWTVKFDTKQ